MTAWRPHLDQAIIPVRWRPSAPHLGHMPRTICRLVSVPAGLNSGRTDIKWSQNVYENYMPIPKYHEKYINHTQQFDIFRNLMEIPIHMYHFLSCMLTSKIIVRTLVTQSVLHILTSVQAALAEGFNAQAKIMTRNRRPRPLKWRFKLDSTTSVG